MTDERARFERAYVATRYLLGARREALCVGLSSSNPEIAALCEALNHANRAVRAERLARELAPIGRALSALWSPAGLELPADSKSGQAETEP